MKTDENNPRHWLRSARSRLGSSDQLFCIEGPSEAVIELLQEAVERFLKGYLLHRGWRLRRVHDLGALVEDARSADGRFAEFAEMADSLTDQFWAQHYPGGDMTDVGADYPEMRAQVARLVELIERETAASGERSNP